MEGDVADRGVPPPGAAAEDVAVLVQRLLAAYQQALELAARRAGLFWWIPHGRGPLARVPHPRLRALVPAFAAAHAARSTRELRRRLHGAAVDAGDPGLYGREVALLDRFEQSLPSAPKRVLASVVVIGLLAVSYLMARTLGGTNDDLRPLSHLIGGLFLLSRSDVVGALEEYRWKLAAIYFTALGLTVSLSIVLALPISSFRLKRILFNACPDGERDAEALARIDPRASSGGVYELERALFARLGGNAPRELRFDLVLDGAISLLACVVGVYLALTVLSYPSGPGFVVGSLRHPRDRASLQFLGTALLVLASLARLRQIRRLSARAPAGAGSWRLAARRPGAPAAPAPVVLGPASWSRRAAATLLDGLALYTLLIPVGAAGAGVDWLGSTSVATGVVDVLLVALPVAYVAASHATSGPHGYASPGKRVLGLAVADRAGRLPPLRRMLVREVALKWLLFSPALVLLVYPLLDYLRPLRRADGLTLHDRMTGTHVVRLAAERPAEAPALVPA